MPERLITPHLPGLAIIVGMMPILPMPGDSTPGQFGPTMRLFEFRSACLTRTMSLTGMPSVIVTMNSMPASIASRIASAQNGGGTKITDALAPVSFTASATVLKIGKFVFPFLTALAGRHTAHHLGVVLQASAWYGRCLPCP